MPIVERLRSTDCSVVRLACEAQTCSALRLRVSVVVGMSITQRVMMTCALAEQSCLFKLLRACPGSSSVCTIEMRMFNTLVLSLYSLSFFSAISLIASFAPTCCVAMRFLYRHQSWPRMYQFDSQHQRTRTLFFPSVEHLGIQLGTVLINFLTLLHDKEMKNYL